MKRETWLRALALSLAFVLSLGMLASCGGVVNSGNGGDGGSGGVDEGGGDRTEDGGWDSVNFDGQTVRFCISVNQYEECTFPAADIYIFS